MHTARAQQTLPLLPTDTLWQDVNRASLPLPNANGFQLARSYRTLKMNRPALFDALNRAPLEASKPTSNTLLSLPLPDGSLASFRLEESSVLPVSLAAKYPALKSFRGEATDNSGALMRCDWSPRGLHATILYQNQWVSIHPLAYDNADYYVSYYGSQISEPAENLRCQVDERLHSLGQRQSAGAPLANIPVGPVRHTYRLALATTVEYTNNATLGGGSIATTMATLNTWVNALNVIYEKELSVRFVLAENNDQVIFTAEPDGLTADDNSKMLNESRVVFETNLGLDKFDLGQVLSPGIGGVAFLGVVCRSDNYKGGGVTLVNASRPAGTGYGLLTLAHEIGHHFNAHHTFSDTVNSNCNGAQFPPNTAYESYGGLTIMSYAEACTRIVWFTAPHFHSGSYAQMSAFINDPNKGGGCAMTTNTGNQAPTITVGGNYTIPKGTPFTLTASGSDPDASDVANLTYSWEQLDAGTNPASVDGSMGPLFRPFLPTSSPTRTFPSLKYILNNANVPSDALFDLKTAETLPNVARDLNFRCMVRDGRGGVNVGAVLLTVTNAGPFLVTAPNTPIIWTGGTQQIVTWSVNNTNVQPVNCQAVKISLSLDDGATFPIVLAASVPNTGAATITVPSGLASDQARLKVEAVENIFFDISDTKISLMPGTTCPAISSIEPAIGAAGSSVTLNGINFTGVAAVTFANNVNASFTIVSNSKIVATIPNAAGNGAITLTKANCAATNSDLFTVTPKAAYVSQVDDSSIESSSRFSGAAQFHYVNRLTPISYPATLLGISLFIPNTVEVGTEYRLVIGLNTSGSGNIDGLPLLEIPIKTPAKNQLVTFPVPNTTIASGDFVVGFAHVPQDGVFPVGIDTSPPAQNRSYNSGTGGAQFNLVTTRNYAIRALLVPGELCTPQTCGSKEADVSPRPNGNGSVSIADWTQVGRFVAGLDTPLAGSEFQRADCAPRATFGDSKITVADWVQAGRYAAGLDPLALAAGPTNSANPLLSRLTTPQLESTRELRAMNTTMLRGSVNSLAIRLTGVGNENALGFSLSFDPRLLSFYRATGIAGATLTVNTKQVAQGRLGILLSSPAGQTFAAGEAQIVNLELLPQGGEADTTTRISFNDQVIGCELADVKANAITQFTRIDSDITIRGRAAAHVSAASYVGTQAASDSIISAFGSNLATVTQAAMAVPLPLLLGGTRVIITDSAGNEHAAPLFFVSPNQINYLIPSGLPTGAATVVITNAAGAVTRGLLKLERVAPGIFTANDTGRGFAVGDVQHVRQDGTQNYERVAHFDPNTNQFVANPIALLPDEQAFLILYGTGLRNRAELSAVKARIGGLEAEVLYVGSQGSYAGLDQINLRLPPSLLGSGEVSIEIEIDGQITNPVKVSVQ